MLRYLQTPGVAYLHYLAFDIGNTSNVSAYYPYRDVPSGDLADGSGGRRVNLLQL